MRAAGRLHPLLESARRNTTRPACSTTPFPDASQTSVPSLRQRPLTGLWLSRVRVERTVHCMTLSRPRQRTRSLLLLGLVLSVLLHLLGGGLWALWARTLARITPRPMVWASRQEAPPAATVIRIEHRAAAAAAPAHENRVTRVAPRPHPIATAAPAAPQPKHELAHIAVHAPAQAPATAFARSPVVTPRRIKPLAPAVIAKPQRAYSDRQIAVLTQSFSKTIAESRQTLGSVQSASDETPVVTMKHYSTHVAGIHEGMNPGDGDIWPISRQRIGNTMWYYVRYSYVHGDGTYESDAVPWPFHYAIGDDPFARGDKRIPLQPPPDGYKPDRPLKPILMRYFGGPDVLD